MDTNNSSRSTVPSEQISSHEALNQQARQALDSETPQAQVAVLIQY